MTPFLPPQMHQLQPTSSSSTTSLLTPSAFWSPNDPTICSMIGSGFSPISHNAVAKSRPADTETLDQNETHQNSSDFSSDFKNSSDEIKPHSEAYCLSLPPTAVTHEPTQLIHSQSNGKSIHVFYNIFLY